MRTGTQGMRKRRVPFVVALSEERGRGGARRRREWICTVFTKSSHVTNIPLFSNPRHPMDQIPTELLSYILRCLLNGYNGWSFLLHRLCSATNRPQGVLTSQLSTLSSPCVQHPLRVSLLTCLSTPITKTKTQARSCISSSCRGRGT